MASGVKVTDPEAMFLIVITDAAGIFAASGKEYVPVVAGFSNTNRYRPVNVPSVCVVVMLPVGDGVTGSHTPGLPA